MVFQMITTSILPGCRFQRGI